MSLVSKSDMSTGNCVFASYALQSNDLIFAFTAPYSRRAPNNSTRVPLPHYSQQQAYDFVNTHGLAVRAVGLLVADAAAAFDEAVKNGATAVLPPLTLSDDAAGGGSGGSSSSQVVAEVELYGDVVMRFVSGSFSGPFLAGWDAVGESPEWSSFSPVAR